MSDNPPTNPANLTASEQSQQPGSTNQEAVKQGSKGGLPANQLSVGAQTNSVQNRVGEWIAWDVIEEYSRANGVNEASRKFDLAESTIHSRKKRHKWKKIPDGRTLAKRNIQADAQIVATNGNLSEVIGAHRATVFEKTAQSIAKFKPKAPRNFKELKTADDIVRRSLGIDDDKPAQQSVLIHINEAIDAHQSPEPIEATIVEESAALLPESVNHDTSESGEQGSTTPPAESNAPPERHVPKESDAPQDHNRQGTSVTLNQGDSARRQFVVP